MSLSRSLLKQLLELPILQLESFKLGNKLFGLSVVLLNQLVLCLELSFVLHDLLFEPTHFLSALVKLLLELVILVD